MSFSLRRYRVLVGVYTIALFFGVREYRVSRSRGPITWPSDKWLEMTEVIVQINPDEPDTEWLQSMASMAEGDAAEFSLHLEDALASDIKHNEFLLQDYTQLMLDRGADYQIVNWAAKRWRENHPFSRETLGLRLGTGPRGPAEEAVLEEALAEVPWIAGSQLESHTDSDGNQRWVVRLTFRPAKTIDLREAIAAVTVLSLTEEQRSRFEVRCVTLVDCTLKPRSR